MLSNFQLDRWLAILESRNRFETDLISIWLAVARRQSLSKKIPRNIGTVTPTILLSSGDHKYVAWHATAKNLHLSECRQSLTSTRLCIRPPFPTPSSLDYQFLSFPFLPFLARYKTVRTDKFVGLFVEINRISNITTSNTRDKYKYKS